MVEQLSLFDSVPVKAGKVDLRELKNVLEGLESSYCHHAELLAHGGYDPFWPDGVNLNLVRNHIIYYKQKLLEFSKVSLVELPEIYYRHIPDMADDEYQAPGTQSGKHYIFRNVE